MKQKHERCEKCGKDAVSVSYTHLDVYKRQASVWVKNSGNREVTLGVDCGGKETTSTIDRATTRMNVGEGLKWHGERLTRMRVEFKVPEGVTTAKLYVCLLYTSRIWLCCSCIRSCNK